jgi:CRISPR-associated Csx2 family protein
LYKYFFVCHSFYTEGFAIGVKFFSFLGAGKYSEYIYQWDGHLSSPTRYVQKALLELLCHGEPEPVRVVMFLTETARRMHWEPDLQVLTNTEPSGLHAELRPLEEQGKIRIENPVAIPDGNTEEEIWEVFDRVSRRLEPGDEVIFDITHSFRFQPMLAMLVLHFARLAKNITIRGIYYGKVDPGLKRGEIAPIVDLTLFGDLQAWIDGVSTFVQTGRADSLNRWIHDKEADPHAKNGIQNTVKSLQNLGRKLEELTSSLETCRGMVIQERAAEVLQLCDKVLNRKEIPAPFRPFYQLVRQIREKVSDMAISDPVESGLEAVEWCKRHGLIQQAYTILDELVTTTLGLAVGLGEKQLLEHEWRKALIICCRTVKANSAETTKREKGTEEDDHAEGRENDLRKQALTPEQQEWIQQWKERYPRLFKLHEKLKNDRNDLNHAGMRNGSKKPEEFVESLEQKYRELITELRRFWSEQKERVKREEKEEAV